MRKQEHSKLRRFSRHGEMQCSPSLRVTIIHICTRAHKKPNDVRKAFRSGMKETVNLRGRREIHIGTKRNQEMNHRNKMMIDCQKKRCQSFTVAQIWISSMPQKKLCIRRNRTAEQMWKNLCLDQSESQRKETQRSKKDCRCPK